MTDQERFIQEMKSKFGDLVDLRICLNGDGGFMAWDARVAFWAWQAAQQKEGYVLVPVEPTYLMIKRAAESVCKEWEGTPTSLVEFLDFSGENMARLVIAEALRQAVKAAQEPT